MNPNPDVPRRYPNDPLSNPPFKRELDEWRAYVGRFGITGRMQARLCGNVARCAFPAQPRGCACLPSRQIRWS